MYKDRTKGWLGQRSIIRSLEKNMGEDAMKHRLGLHQEHQDSLL